jgi:hypothetical protein
MEEYSQRNIDDRKQQDHLPMIIGSCVAFVAFIATPGRLSILKDNKIPPTFLGGFIEGVGSVRLWSAAILGVTGWMTSRKILSHKEPITPSR